MNYTEILNHEPTAATVRVLDKITAHVERVHAEHPNIPEHVIWDHVERAVEHAINDNPFTTTATAAGMIATFNGYLAANADQPFNVLVADLEAEIKTALHLPADD